MSKMYKWVNKNAERYVENLPLVEGVSPNHHP